MITVNQTAKTLDQGIKNMMAGAVLLVSIGSIIIGLYIFLPHLNNLLERGII